MEIGREAAKQMFRDDKNSQGCYRSVMTKIDKIYDSLDEALKQGQSLPTDSVGDHVPEDIQIFLHRLRIAQHPEIRKEAVALIERHCR